MEIEIDDWIIDDSVEKSMKKLGLVPEETLKGKTWDVEEFRKNCLGSKGRAWVSVKSLIVTQKRILKTVGSLLIHSLELGTKRLSMLMMPVFGSTNTTTNLTGGVSEWELQLRCWAC